ncbi:uncharacterized protein E0L32_006280 [Thyridium curvatum]|uniref:Uncharacterized protein n=1 Tax=Thyridium curvatum TaxID=1093900 RepID=A0A507B0P9_9PEZI|nr:uncharacterized protein E0L32_006280 [Thyridium curvatum]TPX13307.1 hypothetical protein E0L32_006280 [Thyridium curvatum]
MVTRLLRLTLLGALATTALCGSHAWETKLQEPADTRPLPVDAAGYAIKDPSREHQFRKRWIGLRTDSTESLWPEKTISYCYSTSEAKDKLAKFIKQATMLWHQAGLHKDVYKYKEVANPGGSCTGYSNRANTLVINVRTDKPYMDSTVGLPLLNARDTEYKGPTMNLDYENARFAWTARGQAVVATIAHEFGHAWGLYHEHQNRYFWNAPVSFANGVIFGDKFDCAAIPGYMEVLQKAIADGNGDERLLCVSKRMADKYNFTAGQWLPWRTFKSKNSYYAGQSYDDVDWESIMLYGSSDGSATGTPILLRNDGQSFQSNFRPSLGDVEGIRTLYEPANSFSGGFPVLPNSSKSPFYTKFINMFKKNKGC